MVTWKSSPPALRMPMRYFLLASEALWTTWNERGVLAEKNLLRVSRACFLEQLRDDEMTVRSRLSANQLEREAASPAARYLVMDEKTENSSDGGVRRALVVIICPFCAKATAETQSAKAAAFFLVRNAPLRV